MRIRAAQRRSPGVQAIAHSFTRMALTLPAREERPRREETHQREEIAGLAIAIIAHAALVALIVLRPATVAIAPPPERMTVTLSDDVAPAATAPEPQSAPAAAAAAPMLAPEPAPAAAVPAQIMPAPAPQPLPRVEPKAEPKLQPVIQPRVEPAPAPRPIPRLPKAMPKLLPAPPAVSVKSVTKPQAKPVAASAARPVTASRMIAFRNMTPPGASRLSSDFLKGAVGAKSVVPARSAATQSATVIGSAVQSALSSAISRQLKPRWSAPQGAEVDQLITILTWRLNPDGSLAGTPQVVRQEGQTDANRAQAARHAEQAIRAVQLAAPFTLPPEYYDAWKRVASFRFDRRLSQ